jgi:hypothetical protein
VLVRPGLVGARPASYRRSGDRRDSLGLRSPLPCKVGAQLRDTEPQLTAKAHVRDLMALDFVVQPRLANLQEVTDLVGVQ